MHLHLFLETQAPKPQEVNSGLFLLQTRLSIPEKSCSDARLFGISAFIKGFGDCSPDVAGNVPVFRVLRGPLPRHSRPIAFLVYSDSTSVPLISARDSSNAGQSSVPFQKTAFS